MATIETRPFMTAGATAVELDLELQSPNVPISELAGEWEYGQDVVVKLEACLKDSFWSETQIAKTDTVRLTVTATCFSARASWVESAIFVDDGKHWKASTTITIDGTIASEEALVNVVISGPGRTRSDDMRFAIHDHAKLWESKRIVLPLEQAHGFPTSALSFEEAGRHDVPWMVEVAEGVDVEQSYSSAVRLYVNTDLAIGAKIIDTTAPAETFMMIETEIQFAVLHALWRTSSLRPEVELLDIAEQNPQNFVALGVQYAHNLGLPVKEAMRLAHEEPLKLLAASREKQRFMNKKVRQK